MESLLRKFLYLIFLYLGACSSQIVDDKLVPLPSNDTEELNQQIRFWGKLIDENPNKADYYFRRAKVYAEANKELLAFADIEKATRLDSMRASYFFLKASILDTRKEYAKALVAAKKAEELGFQEVRLQKLLGKLFTLNQEEKNARPYLQAAQKIFPNDKEIYYYQGLVYSAAKDTSQAVEAFGTALNIEPNYEEVFVALVNLYQNLDMPKTALEYAQNGVKRMPKSALLNYKTAKILLAENKKHLAYDYFQRTLQADSTFWQASFELFKFHYQQSDLKTAGKFLEKALKENPKITNGFLQLAWIYENQYKDFKASLNAYEKAQKDDPQNPKIPTAIERLKKRIAEEAYKQTDEYKEMMKQRWLRMRDSLKRISVENDSTQ